MQNLLYLCALFDAGAMNYIVFILVIAMIFGFSDFLTERDPRLQRGIYYLALIVITFLFTIKYYYGADINTYVPFYDQVPTVSELLAHPDDIPHDLELGYAIFCRVMKDMGVSFYWMTAIISLLYFGTIALLFRQIKRKRAFALAILVVLDYNCIFATYRQCLAVTCFVLMVLCMQNRKYFWVAILAILTALFHKSGAFVVAVMILYGMVRGRWVKPVIYQTLLAVLVLVFLLPIADISQAFISHLPIPANYAESINHHLMLGKQVQVVFAMYAAVLFLISYYSTFRRSRMGSIAAVAFVGLAFVAVLYQYYYLLWRIRSYFLPLIIVYGFNLVQSIEDEQIHVPYGRLVRQMACLVIFVYLGHFTYLCKRSSLESKHDIYEVCTVFDLVDHRASDVQKSQLLKAKLWWEEDFMKNQQNKVNR